MSRRPSPLALVVLVLLHEQPLHTYRLHKLIVERGKDRVVNVASRNSVQQTVHRLEREGLIEAALTERAEGFPERTVYRITEAGTDAMRSTLREALSRPASEYPVFVAALASAAVEQPGVVAELLEERRRAVAAAIADQEPAPPDMPRVLTIEEEYREHMARAELAWLDRTLGELRSGNLDWDIADLVAWGRAVESGRPD
ncbi:PadR family transcriptional regulator [Nocardiopsis halotolerans]|uniref:PadR family transcriptional regulator n=1 Tax=Nocardiopsis halotolerans TaxID=124252 RepID=UPI0003485FDA|nr:helix-turn-helix transcriptional regulator [Nocardiopsis halotolerans]